MILPFGGSGALARVNTEVSGYSNGKTYGEILQRLLNAMAWGQNDPASGNARGGWNYGFNETHMDGSTAGWNILAILDAEAGGAVIPSFLKSEFSIGLNKSYNTDGSFDYNADNDPGFSIGPSSYRNVARSGIGAQSLFLQGASAGSAQGLATQAFISSRWAGSYLAGDYTGTCGLGQNKGCAYGMFNVFKGLKLLGVTTLPGVTRPAGPGTQPAGDWYADYQDWLVTNQTSPATTGGGHWAGMQFSCCEASVAANAAIAELILSPVALVLPDEGKFSTVGLSPATNTALYGGTHTVTAKAESTGGAPVPGATVTFTILSGPNAGQSGTNTTGAAGTATFT